MEAAATPIYVLFNFERQRVSGGASMLMTRLFPLSGNRNTSSVSLLVCTRSERAQDWGKGKRAMVA
jgi:hypothetical protein